MELFFRFVLDITLIGLIIAAIVYAIRVERHLSGIRASRAEMERFVHDFGSTVNRAEAGIKGLKQVARDSGDDLERLIERAQAMRDELKFVVEHADQLAEKISGMGAQLRQTVAQADTAPHLAAPTSNIDETSMDDAHVKSRAERELMRALQKLRS